MTRTRAWSAEEQARLDRTPLIRIAVARADGTLRPYVLIGHVRLGQDELIRSLHGPTGSWYRAAVHTGHGRIDIDGHRIQVAFLRDSGQKTDVDEALRARYGNDSGVRQMTRSPAREATLRILPRT